MKVGSELRLGVLVTIGLIVALAGPAAAQSISVVVNTTTANPGDTITGSVQIDGLPTGYTGYQGHTVRVAIDPPGAITQDAGLPDITYTNGDIGIPPGVGSVQTVLSPESVTMMNASLLQILFPTVITTFPATVFNFSFELSSSFTGLTLHVVAADEAGTGNSQLAITTPEGNVSITTPPFEILNDATISSGGAVDTPTPTPTPEATETPGEITPTPTPTVPIPLTGYIVLDGFGAMHSIGVAPSVTGNDLYYPGIDIVVDMDILPDQSGVVVIDNMGGNFVFGLGGSTPSVPVNPFYVPESVLPPVIFDATPSYVAAEAADDSAGYWVLSDVGQLYGVGSVLAPGATQSLLPGAAVDPPLPAYNPNESNFYNPDGSPVPEGENPGWFSAVDFIVVEDGLGVVVADRWGGQHIIGDTSDIGVDENTIHPYFGWDIARAIEIEPQGKGYMLLDGFGAVHPVPSLPLDGPVREAYNLYIGSQPYFGWDVAESIAYAPSGMGWVTLDAFGGTHYAGQITDVRELYFGWDIARDIEIYIE